MEPGKGKAITTIKKILWPADFSHGCDLALPYVCSLAQKYGAELELLYVAQDFTDHPAWYGELERQHTEKMQRWEVTHAEKKLEEVCQTDLKVCPILERKVVLGDPAQQILKVIGEDGIDMVIMASRGRGAELHGTDQLGSVAAKIIRSSPVPVTIINPAQVEA